MYHETLNHTIYNNGWPKSISGNYDTYVSGESRFLIKKRKYKNCAKSFIIDQKSMETEQKNTWFSSRKTWLEFLFEKRLIWVATLRNGLTTANKKSRFIMSYHKENRGKYCRLAHIEIIINSLQPLYNKVDKLFLRSLGMSKTFPNILRFENTTFHTYFVVLMKPSFGLVSQFWHFDEFAHTPR